MARNFFLATEPGLDMEFRCRNWLYFMLKVKYKFLVGRANFGNVSQFADYDLAVGLVIRVYR